MNIYGRKCPLKSCQDLTRTLLEALLAAEFRLFQANEKSAGRTAWRNGFARKIVRGRFGEITIRVPRDRAGLFTPFVIKKGFVMLGDLEQTFLQVYGVYNGPRGGRLYTIRDLIDKLYSDNPEHKAIQMLTEAVVLACRAHRRMLVRLRCKPVGPGVRFRYEGVSAGYRRGAAQAGGGPALPAECCFVAESPAREPGGLSVTESENTIASMVANSSEADVSTPVFLEDVRVIDSVYSDPESAWIFYVRPIINSISSFLSRRRAITRTKSRKDKTTTRTYVYFCINSPERFKNIPFPFYRICL